MKRRFIFILFSILFNQFSWAQPAYLLTDLSIQLESTEAIDSMYNFSFQEAEKQFTWITQEHPNHPLGYLLLAMNNWWKILPEDHIKTNDTQFYKYIDITVRLSKQLLKEDPTNEEADFFLASAYGLKARRHSDQDDYTKALSATSSALKYLEIEQKRTLLSPEFLFGEGMYNYFREWISDNKRFLKPIMLFFKKGDRGKGLAQLREASNNAFYSRIEAMIFHMKVIGEFEEKKDIKKASNIAAYLHSQYPQNSYFENHLAKYTFYLGKRKKALTHFQSIYDKYEHKQVGYGLQNGRLASYHLGVLYNQIKHNTDSSMYYYKQCVSISEELGEAFTSRGYCKLSLTILAKNAIKNNDMEQASSYYEKVLNYSKKNSSYHKEARSFFKKEKKRKRRNL
ncbi:MAG: hypothetical protein AB8B61_04965 [Cyclobacteriaceae bacterium]